MHQFVIFVASRVLLMSLNEKFNQIQLNTLFPPSTENIQMSPTELYDYVSQNYCSPFSCCKLNSGLFFHFFSCSICLFYKRIETVYNGSFLGSMGPVSPFWKLSVKMGPFTVLLW